MSTLDCIFNKAQKPSLNTRPKTAGQSAPEAADSKQKYRDKVAMLKLAQDNSALREKVAQFENFDRAVTLAHTLMLEGEVAPEDFLTKVAELAKSDMDVVEKAINMKVAGAGVFGNLENDAAGIPGTDTELDPLTSLLISLGGR